MVDTLATMPKRETESIRLDKELVRKARVIAAAAGKSLPEYLEERLRPIIDREFPRTVKGLAQEADSDT